MRHPSQPLILVPRASVDIHSHAREMSRQRLRSHSNTIRKSRKLIKLDGILKPQFRFFPPWKVWFSSAGVETYARGREETGGAGDPERAGEDSF